MELIELLKTRRTYRRFKQEPIADACIDDYIMRTFVLVPSNPFVFSYFLPI